MNGLMMCFKMLFISDSLVCMSRPCVDKPKVNRFLNHYLARSNNKESMRGLRIYVSGFGKQGKDKKNIKVGFIQMLYISTKDTGNA